MAEYDVCVVGAGISGLVAANKLLDEGNKVVVLEKHNKVGGIAKTTVKGRFEFKYPLLDLYLDNDKFPYSLNNMFENDIEFVKLNELFRLYSPKSDITFVNNKAKAKELLASLVPDSVEAINTFFDLAYECRDALNYISNNIDALNVDFIKEEFNNFMRVSSYSVSQVMDSLGLPIFVQEVINSYWLMYGSTETSISFVDYASNLVNALDYGVKVPVDGSYGVALSLAQRFLIMGGEIKLNSEVVNIIVEDNQVNGVKTNDGKIIYCNKVVVNSTMETVYSKLIKPEDVPRDAYKDINSREKGGKLFTVNLGLNRSVEELGIKNYLSFVYHSLDSDLELEKMKEMGWRNIIAVAPNVVDKDASPEGTAILSLNTVFFDDTFSEYTDVNNYYRDISEIAERMIDTYQKFTKLNIASFIEEIDIVSPIDVAVATNSIDGNAFGFRLNNLDNYLPRTLNQNNEKYIKGLEICGGFDGDFYGYSSNLYAGYNAALNIEKAGE